MKQLILLTIIGLLVSCKGSNAVQTPYNVLTEAEKRIILEKGTEPPYSGKYDKFYEAGSYHCKQCNEKLYESTSKFNSNCGWPSFDDEVPGAVLRVPDPDGMRTEIICANCKGHLGHVFLGEGFTEKNTRHCVNSLSLIFKPALPELIKKAYFAGGCFWGVEHLFEKMPGVIDAVSGYMGGTQENPSYQDVIYRNTGHLEVVEITYDANKVDYESLAKFFFEIHDPTQKDGQGPDIGYQYKSAIFVNDDEERHTIRQLIYQLKKKKYDVVTEILPISPFWKAEAYHQDYYVRTGKAPYCHAYTKRF